MLLFLFSFVFFVFPIDSKYLEHEVEISKEIIELNEYVTKEIRNFTEFYTSTQFQQSQRIRKLYEQNEIASLEYVLKRIALINESIASVERKNICKNSTFEQFSWVLLRFPLQYQLNCSASINRIYFNEFNSNDFTYMEHISWVTILKISS
ncbi:uncharacterized protein LOC122501786 isoform X2 [Leptopilina heterotoma]|uniref:uncharacterized protein LOC122501786 isoform X2 n=1 Tax=Leptopilina heterotoma TaxID=63436 RepID=UPI001CA9CD56|nr:uncharacterized protein LOC122501786 isoform X2 [Leptopilina heterotoma]